MVVGLAGGAMSGEHVYDAYVEARSEGTIVAQILDLPGCYGLGANETEALERLVAAIPEYYDWLRRHDDYTPAVQGPFQVSVRERQGPGAFFAADAVALSPGELDWHLALLDWAFQDLAALVSALPPGTLDQMQLGGRPASQTLAHALERSLAIFAGLDVSAAPQLNGQHSVDAPGLLQRARAAWEVSAARLRETTPEQRAGVFEWNGERWSVGKLLRRGILLIRELTNELEGARAN